jgi:hypothetical protein
MRGRLLAFLSGYSTYHGVVAFQKVNGLVRHGIMGPRTWAALASPVIPRPRRWRSGSSLEVNLTRQVVYLARQGVVLRILDASTGKATTPTPDRRLLHLSPHRRLAAEHAGPVVAAELLLPWLCRTRLNLGARLPCQPRVHAVDGPGHEPSVVAAAHRHARVGLPLTLAARSASPQ